MGMDRLPGLSLAINMGRPPYPILGDPGAAHRAGRKGARKVFKPRWKTPWVPTLELTGSFPNSQANAGSWLATKHALYYCAQSANSFSWDLFVTRRPFSRHSCPVCSPSFPYQKWRCSRRVGKLGAISRSNSICTEKILFLMDHNVS